MSDPTQTMFHADSLANALSGLGVAGLDKAVATSVNVQSARMADVELETLVKDNAFARNIVEAVPEESLRDGFAVVVTAGDEDVDREPFADELERLKLEDALYQAARSARMYGGGAILIGVDDGQTPDQPLNEAAVRRVRFLVPTDSVELKVVEWENDPASDRFGQPRMYQYSPITGMTGASATASLRWHHSRVVPFEGNQVSKRERIELLGWGDSVLQSCRPQLVSFTTIEQAFAHIVHEYEIMVLRMSGLREAAASPDGRTRVQERARLFRSTMGIARLGVIDKDEDLTRITAQVSGLADIYDRAAASLAGAANIPVSRLFGTPPKGFSTDDKGAARTWYDRLRAYRRLDLTPAILRICELLRRSPGIRLPESVTVSVEWPELDAPTALESADIEEKQARASEILWRIGAIDELEVREQLRSRGVALLSAEQRAELAGDAPTNPTAPVQ